MVDWQQTGAESAPVLAALWARAAAHRDGVPLPASAPADLVDLLQDRLTGPEALAVIGRVAGQPVACGMATPLDGAPAEPRGAHLSLLAVEPARWGEGLGRAVLGRLEEDLRAAGYARGELHVLSANSRARALYESAGWVLLREDPPHRDGPQVVYGKDRLTVPG